MIPRRQFTLTPRGVVLGRVLHLRERGLPYEMKDETLLEHVSKGWEREEIERAIGELIQEDEIVIVEERLRRGPGR